MEYGGNEYDELREAIRAALRPGEKVLWQGLPQPRPIGWSFMIGLFAALAGFSALAEFFFGGSIFSAAVVVLSIYAYYTAALAFILTLKAPPTFYIVTDRRALVIAAGQAPEVFEPSQMVFREKRKNNDGSYDLYFLGNRAAAGCGEGDTAAKPSGFHDIRRVRSAEKVLLELMRRTGLPAEPATASIRENPSWPNRPALRSCADGISAGLTRLFRRPFLLCIITTVVFVIVHAVKPMLF